MIVFVGEARTATGYSTKSSTQTGEHDWFTGWII